MTKNESMAEWLERNLNVANERARVNGWRQTNGGNWVCVTHPKMRWRHKSIPDRPCDQCQCLDVNMRRGHL